jgi:U1 small nuclear ribonucleoprotein
MTCLLPPNLLRLFAPRPPVIWLPPCDKELAKRKKLKYTGLAEYMGRLDHDQDYTPAEKTFVSKEERVFIVLIKIEKRKFAVLEKVDKRIEQWDPYARTEGDPYKTLFVGNLVSSSVYIGIYDVYVGLCS